ncbi:MAG: orotate phosphoribosyltransferase [Bdellovibrionota bacterium]
MKTLLDYLRQDALKTGVDIVLASGQRSTYYVDTKQISLQGPSLALIGEEFWKLLKKQTPKPDCVAGVSLGGDPLASAAILEAHLKGVLLEAFLIRKEAKGHGATQGGRVEGRKHLRSELKSLWLLEDVISTGGSSLSAAKHLVEEGYPLKGIACILDREMGGVEKLSAELKLPVLALYRIRDVLKDT